MKSTTIYCLRSARGDDRRRGVAAGPADPGAAYADVGQCRRFCASSSGSGATGPVQCCYEAGPVWLRAAARPHVRTGIPCDVIAPALIPRRPGDRVKTDRRDAGHLAVLYRAGALTAIHIPTEQEEAARDLLRCREDIRADLLRARHRLSKFLLRHGRRFTATKKAWSKRHDAWLAGADAGRSPRSSRRTAPICAPSTKPSPASRPSSTDLRALLTLEPLRPRVAAPPVLPRHRRSHRAHHRRRTRRCAPLCHGAPRHGLRRPRPVRAFQWDQTGARRDHQDRQCHLRRVLVESAWHYRHHPFVGACAPQPATRRARPPSLRRPGPRNSGCIAATSGSPPAANRNSTLSPPSPASSPAFSGPR